MMYMLVSLQPSATHGRTFDQVWRRFYNFVSLAQSICLAKNGLKGHAIVCPAINQRYPTSSPQSTPRRPPSPRWPINCETAAPEVTYANRIPWRQELDACACHVLSRWNRRSSYAKLHAHASFRDFRSSGTSAVRW